MSLSERAYSKIRSMILERRLAGGRVIVEGQLADELRISRTPVREALGRLVGEGLLVKQASRYFSVRHVSAGEFFQSMRVRELLETEAVALADGRIKPADVAELRRAISELPQEGHQTALHWRLDDQLHELFARGSGNDVLADLVSSLRVTTRLFEVSRPFGRLQADVAEHLAILDPFLAGDAAAARRAMRHHLRQLQKEVIAEISGT